MARAAARPAPGDLRPVRPSCGVSREARRKPGLPELAPRRDRVGPHRARPRQRPHRVAGEPGGSPDHGQRTAHLRDRDLRHRPDDHLPAAGERRAGRSVDHAAESRERRRDRRGGQLRLRWRACGRRRRRAGGPARGVGGPGRHSCRGRGRCRLSGPARVGRQPGGPGFRRLRGAELELHARLAEALALSRCRHLHRRCRPCLRPAEPDRPLGPAAGRGRLAVHPHVRGAAGVVRAAQLSGEAGCLGSKGRCGAGSAARLRAAHAALLRHGGLQAERDRQGDALPVRVDHRAAPARLPVGRVQQLGLGDRGPCAAVLGAQVRDAGHDL